MLTGSAPPAFAWRHLGFGVFRGPAETCRTLDGKAIWLIPPDVDPNPDPELPAAQMAPAPLGQIADVMVPLWIPLLVASLLPTAWLADHVIPVIRRKRRNRLRACERCGYDLRASRDRCPECGTPIPSQQASG